MKSCVKFTVAILLVVAAAAILSRFFDVNSASNSSSDNSTNNGHGEPNTEPSARIERDKHKHDPMKITVEDALVQKIVALKQTLISRNQNENWSVWINTVIDSVFSIEEHLMMAQGNSMLREIIRKEITRPDQDNSTRIALAMALTIRPDEEVRRVLFEMLGSYPSIDYPLVWLGSISESRSTWQLAERHQFLRSGLVLFLDAANASDDEVRQAGINPYLSDANVRGEATIKEEVETLFLERLVKSQSSLLSQRLLWYATNGPEKMARHAAISCLSVSDSKEVLLQTVIKDDSVEKYLRLEALNYLCNGKTPKEYRIAILEGLLMSPYCTDIKDEIQAEINCLTSETRKEE